MNRSRITGLAEISKFEEKVIAHAFPNLRSALESYADPLSSKVAISVFDRWLGEDLHLLDCKLQGEREEREVRKLCFWESIFESTSVYTYRSTSQKVASQNIELMRYVDKERYLADCAYNPEKTSAQFQFVILPEFQAVYQENWDDTNVLWFTAREKVEPLLQQAGNCGLFVLEYMA